MPIVKPNFGFIMGIFFCFTQRKISECSTDFIFFFRKSGWLYRVFENLFYILQNEIALGIRSAAQQPRTDYWEAPYFFLSNHFILLFFVFSTACHPPLFLVENAAAKSADLWAFACRFSTMLKISTKKLLDFPAFSTGANALSTGGSRVFHHQWSFLTGKQQKGIRRTDTPRFALRARHSRESRRLRLRFSPLRSEKFLLRHYRSLPLQRPPDDPTGAQSVCVRSTITTLKRVKMASSMPRIIADFSGYDSFGNLWK